MGIQTNARKLDPIASRDHIFFYEVIWSALTYFHLGNHSMLLYYLQLLGQKLKASRAYLKSLFSKSACSDESSAKNASIKASILKHLGHYAKGCYPLGTLIHH